MRLYNPDQDDLLTDIRSLAEYGMNTDIRKRARELARRAAGRSGWNAVITAAMSLWFILLAFLFPNALTKVLDVIVASWFAYRCLSELEQRDAYAAAGKEPE